MLGLSRRLPVIALIGLLGGCLSAPEEPVWLPFYGEDPQPFPGEVASDTEADTSAEGDSDATIAPEADAAPLADVAPEEDSSETPEADTTPEDDATPEADTTAEDDTTADPCESSACDVEGDIICEAGGAKLQVCAQHEGCEGLTWSPPSQGCLIDELCVEANTRSPENPCLSCQPAADNYAYSALADESPCGDEEAESPAGGALVCIAGLCELSCDEGFGDCDDDVATGCEVDLQSDPLNCGSCDAACLAEYEQCGQGTCTCTHGAPCDGSDADACKSGFWSCSGDGEGFCSEDPGGGEVETCDGMDNDCDGLVDEGGADKTDTGACGLCEYACGVDFGANTNVLTWSCESGVCTPEFCEPGYADLNADGSDGCEGPQFEACEPGEVLGCDDTCLSASLLADGVCHEALNCATHNTDGGDCACHEIVCSEVGTTQCAEDGTQMQLCAIHDIEIDGWPCTMPTWSQDPMEDGCVINGCVPAGEANPENPCQVCDTAQANDAYSSQADGVSCGESFINGGYQCHSGTCTPTCADEFSDCNDELSDGCEVNLGDNPDHCGACNDACADLGVGVADWSCNAGACVIGVCDANMWDIDGLSSSGCEYACEATSELDSCDDVDSDCDGTTDEDGFPCTPIPVQISGHGEVSCALRSDGTVYCWGSATYQTLGPAFDATGDVTDKAATPIHVPLPDSAIDIALGGQVTGYAVLEEGGELWGWGAPSYLFLPEEEETWSTPRPLLIPTGEGDQKSPLMGVVDVEAAHGHACAIVGADRALWCWGQTEFGRLGPGEKAVEDSEWFRAPSPVRWTIGGDAIEGVVDVCTGRNHTCAIIDDGEASTRTYCWGSGDQVGDMADGDAWEPTRVLGANSEPLAVNLAELSCSPAGEHTCGRNEDGSEVYCWGRNDANQLGNGTWETPVDHAVAVIAGPLNTTIETPISALFTTQTRTCGATEEGAFHCWGRGVSYPEPDDALEGALGMSAINDWMDSSWCAWFADGSAACWGQNTQGQLGQGPESLYQDPIVTASVMSGLDPTATDIAGSRYHTCSLVGTEVRCLGDEDYQANGGAPLVDLPKSGLPVVDGLGAPIAALDIEASYRRHCALMTDTTIGCWGSLYNAWTSYGAESPELGQVNRVRAPEGAQGEHLDQVDALAISSASGCAIVGDSKAVYCWGNATFGVADLPPADADSSATSYPTPKLLAGGAALEGASAIDLSFNQESHEPEHACAVIGAEGAVYCWGDNAHGQLGDGTTTQRSEPAPVLRADDTPLVGVVSVALSSTASCALTEGGDSGGTIYCWGSDDYGLMANGEGTTNQHKATLVPGIDGVETLLASTVHMCAHSGQLVACWGHYYGLGVEGVGFESHSPVAVPVSEVSDLFMGWMGSCAKTAGGEIYCWGDNEYDKLGQGLYLTPLPLAVEGLTVPTPVICDAGLTKCNNTCVDLSDDADHCGQCGEVCPAGGVAETGTCSDGSCALSMCTQGQWDLNADNSDGCEYACAGTVDAVEACNLTDDDCDGAVDEGFDFDAGLDNCGSCFTACSFSGTSAQVSICDAGQCAIAECPEGTYDLNADGHDGCEYSCPSIPASDEVCNGVDDNCDGVVDEGLGTETCGLGQCEHTIERCLDGVTQVCDPLEGQSDELCDGLDNDCDGVTDFPEATSSCGLGQCNKEIFTCVDGVEQTCDPMAGASEELCDGLDNDCDGEVDNVEGGCPFMVDVVSEDTGAVCALRRDGSVWCWGRATVASGGSSFTPEEGVGEPTYVALSAPAVEVVVGNAVDTAFAILETGEVVGWGMAGNGLLAIESNDMFTPSPILDINEGFFGEDKWVKVQARAISAGDTQACIIAKEHGEVWCWGVGNFNTLGPTEEAFEAVNAQGARRPAPVTDGETRLASALDLCTSGKVTCALIDKVTGSEESDGQGGVYCWGDSTMVGSDGDAALPSPVVLQNGQPLPPTITAIGCNRNSSHVCALGASGSEAYCWGSNTWGQLGDGTTSAQGSFNAYAVPVKESIFKEGLPVPLRSIYTLSDRTCGVTNDHETYCWGNEQLTPTLDPSYTSLVGIGHRCAWYLDGSVACRGSNNDGLLGQGQEAVYNYAQATPYILEGEVPNDISISDQHICRLEGTMVRCRGAVSGLGKGDASLADQPPAGHFVRYEDGEPISAIAIAAGREHSCAVLSDGGAACWGSLWEGIFGAPPPSNDAAVRVLAPEGEEGLLSGVTAMALNATASCAIAGDKGQVYCWGQHANGVHQEQYPYYEPRAVKTADDEPIVGATAIATSVGTWGLPEHACVILGTPDASEGPQGEVWCWGANNEGQLGIGSTSSSTPHPTQVLLGETGQPLTGVVDIALSIEASCAIQGPSGQLYCWGSDAVGLMADGAVSMAGFTSATEITGLNGGSAIGGGRNHMCLLGGESGSVVCWGQSNSGALGNATWSTETSPVPIPGMSGLESLHVGPETNCGIFADGAACWGSNERDQMGQGLFFSDTYLSVLGLDQAAP